MFEKEMNNSTALNIYATKKEIYILMFSTLKTETDSTTVFNMFQRQTDKTTISDMLDKERNNNISRMTKR